MYVVSEATSFPRKRLSNYIRLKFLKTHHSRNKLGKSGILVTIQRREGRGERQQRSDVQPCRDGALVSPWWRSSHECDRRPQGPSLNGKSRRFSAEPSSCGDLVRSHCW